MVTGLPMMQLYEYRCSSEVPELKQPVMRWQIPFIRSFTMTRPSMMNFEMIWN